jgi:transposase
VPAPKKYPDELRERAIRFALDLVDGPEQLSVNAASKRVGEQLGIGAGLAAQLGPAGPHRRR